MATYQCRSAFAPLCGARADNVIAGLQTQIYRLCLELGVLCFDALAVILSRYLTLRDLSVVDVVQACLTTGSLILRLGSHLNFRVWGVARVTKPPTFLLLSASHDHVALL